MPETAPIQDVGDTALWVAHYRAVETERPDALFQDRFAGRLSGERGRQLAAGMGRAKFYQWIGAIRTRIIDDLVMREVGAGTDAVLNLGAGLDTRPYRLQLPASLHWIEIDQPRILQAKEEALRDERPVCKLERIPLDLASAADRQACFAGLDARFKRVLVITEGVVLYLTNEQAAALAKDLLACKRFQQWIVEYSDAKMSARAKRRGNLDKKLQSSPFKFQPADWTEFFTGCGWKASEIVYHAVEGERLGRPLPMPGLVRALMGLFARKQLEAIRKMIGYAVLVPING